MRSLYFKIYSASVLITFLFPGIATSINMHVPCLLSHYDVQLIVRNSSVGSHILVSLYSNLTFMTHVD